MKLSIESFFNDKNAPLYQAGFLLVVILIGNILAYLIEASGVKTFDDLFPWVISGAQPPSSDKQTFWTKTQSQKAFYKKEEKEKIKGLND